MSTHTLMFEVLALAALCAPEAQSQPPVSLPDEMHIYRIESTFKWDGKLVKVELTGFKPKEREGIYTGLHGVAGAEEVVAISPVVSVGRVKMRLTHVDIKRDVAYLEPVPPKALPRGGLAQGKRKVEELKAGEVLWVVGYPIGIDLRPADTELKLRVLDPVARLTDIINPAAREGLVNRRSPETQVRMLNLQGPFLPGHSGAPLVDADWVVVGIGCGGLCEGTASHGWAVPFQDVELGPADSDAAQMEIERLAKRRYDNCAFLILDENARAMAQRLRLVVTTVLENDAKEPVIALRNLPGDELSSRVRRMFKIMGDLANNNQAELAKLDPLKEIDILLEMYLPSGTRVELLSAAQLRGQPANEPVQGAPPEMPALPAPLQRIAQNAGDLLYSKVRVLEGKEKGKEVWVLTSTVRQRLQPPR